MKLQVALPRVCLLLFGLLAIARPAAAQQSANLELGSSLVDVSVVVPSGGGPTGVLLGVPSATFGISNPGVYLAFVASRNVAVESQIGLLVSHGGGESDHVLNISGQVDYVLGSTTVTSAYVFARVGVLSVTGAVPTPVSIGGGAGYRIRYGDRLVVRLTGSVGHFTSGFGNLVSFAVSIGGLFGK